MQKQSTTNYILHAHGKAFYWEGHGQLSLKTFAHGKAHYKTPRGFFAVEEERYLLLNRGEYTISIEEDTPIESFCLFFRDGFAEEVLRTFRESTDQLLFDPSKQIETVGFFEQTYPTNQILSTRLNWLKVNFELMKADPLWCDEAFHMIMQSLLLEHQVNLSKMERIQALRYATREELFRRLGIAYEYIRAFFDQAITLKDIAETACLSPNHLLRHYAQLFGKTPHQHITELRLQKAKRLLANPAYSMTEIAFELGFHNPVSFSRMFKQLAGISPKQYRKKVIMDKT